MVADVAYDASFGFAHFDVARDGTLAYLRSAPGGLMRLAWVDGRGAAHAPIIAEPGHYQAPRLSPDGRFLAYGLLGAGDFDIWAYDLATRRKTRVATGDSDQSGPLFTPDSRFIVYGDRALPGIFARRRDGQGDSRLLVAGLGVPWSFAPGGRRLAYHAWSAATGIDIWTVPIEAGANALGVGVPELFLGTPAFESFPAFSPDGRWLAYCSDESGAWEVYVRAFPDNGTRVQVSSNGGCIAAWSRRTAELVYRTNARRLMAVSYREQHGAFVAGVPRAWSSVRLADTGVLPSFDLAADGTRAAALIAADAEPPRDRVTLVLDFFEQLPSRP